jgi:hypothetical protein
LVRTITRPLSPLDDPRTGANNIIVTAESPTVPIQNGMREPTRLVGTRSKGALAPRRCDRRDDVDGALHPFPFCRDGMGNLTESPPAAFRRCSTAQCECPPNVLRHFRREESRARVPGALPRLLGGVARLLFVSSLAEAGHRRPVPGPTRQRQRNTRAPSSAAGAPSSSGQRRARNDGEAPSVRQTHLHRKCDHP